MSVKYHLPLCFDCKIPMIQALWQERTVYKCRMCGHVEEILSVNDPFEGLNKEEVEQVVKRELLLRASNNETVRMAFLVGDKHNYPLARIQYHIIETLLAKIDAHEQVILAKAIGLGKR